MNVLVTGGAGHVGSVLVKALIEQGHMAIVLDNLRTGERQAVHSEAAFVRADITDSERVTFALLEHDIEAVIHCASVSQLSSTLGYFEQNTVASLSLLKTLIEYGIEKLVLSSTLVVDDAHRAELVNERSLSIPNAYCESLYLVERMLFWLAQSHRLDYASLRYVAFAGSERGHQSLKASVDKTYNTASYLEDIGQGKEYSKFENSWGMSSIVEAHMLALESL